MTSARTQKASGRLTDTLLQLRQAARYPQDPSRPRMSWRQDLVTCMLATWLIQGLTMDAWAHTNQNTLESVLTPWHALFYGGFAVTAAWIGWRISRNFEAGRSWVAAIPVGYGVALIGMGLFFLSGVGDQIWHAKFGIERDLEAFLSPPHTVLVIGMALLVTAPFRSMWSDPRPRPTSFLSLLPAVWSLALMVLLLALFGNYVFIFASDLPTISRAAFAEGFPGVAPQPLLDVFSARFQVQGVIMLYLTTVLLVAPVLLALRRWRLPFGSITFMWTLVIASNLVAYQYNRGWTLVAVVVGGLIADYLVLRLRPSGDRVGMFRLFAALAPLGLWAMYFLVLAVAYNVGWPAELAVGVGAIAGMITLMVAYVMVPTPIHRISDDPAPMSEVAMPAAATRSGRTAEARALRVDGHVR
jgi:hypothetical protein